MKFLAKLILLSGISLSFLPCVYNYNQLCAQSWNDVRGTWYFQGYPCYIDGRGFSLVLVNERGDRCSGRIDGDVIYADDWGLVGRLTWRAIYWNNGSTWTR
jgi:hypothetical protein